MGIAIGSGSLQAYPGHNDILLPTNLTRALTLLEGFESTTGWTVLAGSAANNTSQYISGTQSIKVTSPSGGLGRISKTVNWSLKGTEVFRLAYYVHDLTKLNYITVFLGDYAGGAYWYKNVSTGLEGWNYVSFVAADFIKVGNPVWSNVPYFRVYVQAVSGQVCEVSFDQFVIIDCIPAVVFEFDDAKASQWTKAFPIFHAHHARAVVAIVSDSVEGVGRLTVAQVQALHRAGWTISNHTRDHADLIGKSAAEVEAEFTDCAAVLVGWGCDALEAKFGVYPGGHYDATVLAGAANAGMLTGLTVTANKHDYLPLIQPNLMTTAELDNSLATLQGYVDDCLLRGHILYLGGHDVDEAGTITSADLDALLAYIASKGIVILTLRDIYDLQSGPKRVRRNI